MTTPQYNTKSAGVRRLMTEAKELRNPTEMYHAQPIDDNLFEWHFTIRGTIGSDFEGGIYHGRIIFPPDYPMKPPNLILLTPNGRFELNRKICLSISGFHPETWLPSWSVRTALLALIGFLPTSAGGALGSLEYPPKERKRLAKLSGDWQCKECGCIMKTTLLPITEDGHKAETEEANKLAEQLKFQDESDVKKAVAEVNSSSEIQKSTPQVHALEKESAPLVEETAAEPSESSPGPAPAPAVVEELRVVQEHPIVAEPVEEDQFPLFQRRLQSSSFDYSLLIIIPMALICVFLFFTLLGRRFFFENDENPLKEL